MELRHLRYFDAVATERNFTRAAEVVGVAQPPLSRQIRELELELGVILFDRTRRPVALTEAGRILHEQVSRILVAVGQLPISVRHLRDAPHRIFAVGVVGSIMHGAMASMIRGFRTQAPDVELDLIDLTTVEQVEALKCGRIDVGLGRVRIDDPAIRREVIGHEPLVVAAPAAHRLSRTPPPAVRLADLRGETLILYPSLPRPSYADEILGLFEDAGIARPRTREVRDVQTALGLVAVEAGVSIVPQSLQGGRRDVTYLNIDDASALSPIIVSQRIEDQRAIVDLFLGIAREHFRDAPAGR